jgi:hypothetical protein
VHGPKAPQKPRHDPAVAVVDRLLADVSDAITPEGI